ncbi:MAG: tetratricopeptide repeat protein [Woeseiaceae bacterium]
MRKLPEFLVEMRKRRVFRVAVIYILGAWGALQVADLAFESWGIPGAALRFVWTGAILGFPIAMLLGWRFDLTGGRIIRISASGDKTDLSLMRADYVILAVTALVIVLTVYGLGAGISEFREQPAAAADTETIDPRSIAVLPMTSTSLDPDGGEFLALGIQDDLLTRLSKIASLKVISRTSVDRYRDTDKSTREIGRELGVSKILEGHVQRRGNQARVNVQLIDAASDEHLWAATYDRDLTAADVFSVQTEIVETIASQLQATLTPQESDQLASMPTHSLEAYTAYLKGQQQANLVSIESLNNAIDHYQEAIRLDPEFALAHVGLADAYLALGSNFTGGLSHAEAIALAEPPLALALSLDGKMGEAQATLGLLRSLEGNLEAAEEAYRRAIELAPSYSYAYRLYGRLRWEQDKRTEALELAEQALALDPYYAQANFDVARYNDIMGNFDEALSRYLRVVDVRPDYALAYVYIGAIYYLVHGKPGESLVWYHRAAESDVLSPSLRATPAIAYLELGDTEGARPWVESGLELGPETYWPLWTSVLLNLAEGDEAAAVGDARLLLETYPRFSFALRIVRDADLTAGRYDVARARYARAHRELIEPEVPSVDVDNYRSAVDLALVLQLVGEFDRADDLLEKSLVVIEELPRLGTDGYWISDARIYALQGRSERALDALRLATEEGWRILTWYFLDRDPNLASLRSEPGFDEIRDIIHADLAAQAEHVRELRASGELGAY